LKKLAYIFVIFALLSTSACTKDGAQVVLQSISFDSNTKTVAVGGSQQLTPVFTPSVFSTISVEWVSTDNSIVAVSSNGIIQPLKKGEAWVKIKDHNSAITGKVLIIVQ
jgi:uncharacterized protein YjdB